MCSTASNCTSATTTGRPSSRSTSRTTTSALPPGAGRLRQLRRPALGVRHATIRCRRWACSTRWRARVRPTYRAGTSAAALPRRQRADARRDLADALPEHHGRVVSARAGGVDAVSARAAEDAEHGRVLLSRGDRRVRARVRRRATGRLHGNLRRGRRDRAAHGRRPPGADGSAATTTPARTRARWKTACSTSTSGTGARWPGHDRVRHADRRRRTAHAARSRRSGGRARLRLRPGRRRRPASAPMPPAICPGALYAHLDHDLSGAKTGRNGRHPLPDRGTLAAQRRRAGASQPGVQVVVLRRAGRPMRRARGGCCAGWATTRSRCSTAASPRGWPPAASSTRASAPPPRAARRRTRCCRRRCRPSTSTRCSPARADADRRRARRRALPRRDRNARPGRRPHPRRDATASSRTTSAADGRFKPAAELRARIRRARRRAERRSCTSADRASPPATTCWRWSTRA